MLGKGTRILAYIDLNTVNIAVGQIGNREIDDAVASEE